ncbi:transglutaminase-like domain-containing protein [Sabulilitoribacter arenilitoris]|uniref:Transglutaminase-like domain-containing protein n=1 Tax=Wocania arenilitoris TaxID=2044858 RepID=A0AAE3JMP1_9FLAO|nr:transglutaminase-like domain-containing protein [Wocania arenilitoris]MCF7569544.1 transglutaminase-like domain-containing protein [Wocania arenilitoris]
MIKKVYFFVFVISFQLSLGQEIEFGKVTKEELLEDVYAPDKSANAAILFQQQKTYFNSTYGANELITEIHKRIKIYNGDGFDYATEVINLFRAGSSAEVARKIKAYTFNIENGKVKKTELEKDQIFKSKLSYNYNQVKLTMPNVKEGSVIDIKYQKRSPFIWSIDEFVFQYDIPIKKLEAEIRTPKGFRFNTTNKGHITFFPKRSTKTDNRLGMQVVINKYFLNNVPALKEESYVDNINNYRAGVMFELVSVEFPGYFKSYSQTWKDVAKTIGSSDDYKNQLDKTNSFDDELDDLISGKTDQVEKMKVIFKYIKDNLKWNGIDGKYFFNGIRKTLKEKKGNVADINLTLVAMLRYAGIDSNPVILSTKDNVIPFFPTVDRLNYVIAYAVINEKKYFLDATEEFSDINLLPVKDYNWKGIYIDNNKLIWKQIDISSPEQAVAQYSINANLNEDGEINGKLSARYTKHNALEFRKEYKDQDEESFIASKEKSLDNIEISNYTVKNTDSYEGFVAESFEYYQENGADFVDGKIYIQPLSFLSLEENPFKLEERKFPVDFGYPFAKKYMVSIAFPEGYTVESTPEPVRLKIPNDLGELKYIPRVTEKNIQLIFTFDIKKPRIMTDNYLFLKQFFNQMIIKCKEQIVLTKA